MTQTRVAPMPKKDRPKRDDASAKIERALVEKAHIIARTLGKTAAEYLSDLVRPGVLRDWPKAMKKLNASEPTPEDE